MWGIKKAREKCATVISKTYGNPLLIYDKLKRGEYISFWDCKGVRIESGSRNIFDDCVPIVLNEYRRVLGNPCVSVVL